MAGTSDAAAAPAGSSRWLKIGLVASVALNLLILGTIGGSLWAFRHSPPWKARSFNAHLLSFAATLPSERRRAIWEATREQRHAMRPLRQDVRAARAEARSALSTEPFDKQRFEAAQMRVLDAEIKARREAQKVFVSIADVLSPQERLAFTRWQPDQEAQRARWWHRNRPEGDAPPASPK